MRIRLKKMKIKIKRMSHPKRRTMIKGEMKIMKRRKMIKKFRVKDRHTQEPPSNSMRSPRQLHVGVFVRPHTRGCPSRCF
jgi:hypothetical protein